jgi:fumarate hydratase subunit alpha
MRDISADKIRETVKNLAIAAGYELNDDMVLALNKALKNEKSENGKEVIRQLIKNSEIARQERYPICQDTGLALVFIELGQEVHVIDGNINNAIQEGVAKGYKEGYLRKSIVNDPFNRKNTNDNTPALIHIDMIPGDKLKITLMAKGGGCENVSRYQMFKPTADKEEIWKFVVETVSNAGASPCPPIIVGVGIGGNLEGSGMLAKKSLLRGIGEPNSDKDISKMEKELLAKINALGIGPQGLGGTVTALDVHIETAPCHIASLPVTVNIDCHAHRVKEAVI